MDISVRSTRPATHRTGALVVPVSLDKRRPRTGDEALDAALGARIRALVDGGDLGTEHGSSAVLHAPDGVAAERVVLVAIGDGDVDDAALRRIADGAASGVLGTPARQAAIVTAGLGSRCDDAEAAARNLTGALLHAAYRFEDYRDVPEREQLKLGKVALLATKEDAAAVRRAVRTASAVAAGVNYARTLGNLPGNVCHPSYLVDEARALAKRHASVKVTVLEEKRMRSLGMGSFLSVTAGSDQPAKLIVIEYRGGKAGAAPRVIVGKGITFDTGGISLKPGPGMDEMKFDMCGAASVMGVMSALPELGHKENVVGLIAAAENMPGGGASRPGDIVRTMSGQTVEILNTDAEGRLVLCDTLTYAARFKPKAMVDVATLTGAAVVALGQHATALYANDDELADALLAAGEETGDRAWRMPLWEDYQQQLKSNFADMANVGGREAGSVTAACFLARFTRDVPWAHLDIAGSAWLTGARKGATGRPVQLLLRWLGAD